MSNKSKAGTDNRSRQLNPTDPTYWSSRGEHAPADVGSVEEKALEGGGAQTQQQTKK